jgi:hypothetical protein
MLHHQSQSNKLRLESEKFKLSSLSYGWFPFISKQLNDEINDLGNSCIFIMDWLCGELITSVLITSLWVKIDGSIVQMGHRSHHRYDLTFGLTI